MRGTRRVSGQKSRQINGQRKRPVTVRLDEEFFNELMEWCNRWGTSPSRVFRLMAKRYWEKFKEEA